MANADLLGALDKQGKFGSLENLILYGRLRCTIAKPKMISNLGISEGCSLAILDAYAIKCLKTDYFCGDGEYGSNSIYFTKGSLVVCVPNKSLVGRDIKVGGTSMTNGVKVKRQLGHTGRYDGITALAFRKEGSSYVIVPNQMKEVTDKLDPHLRGTPLEEFFLKLHHDEPIQYPVSLDSLVPYEGVEDYVETTDNYEGKRFIDDGKKIDISKIDLNLTFHLKGMSGSEYLESISSEAEKMSSLREEFARNLVNTLVVGKDNTLESINDVAYNIRKSFTYNIARNYDNNIGFSKIKGKFYVESLLDEFVYPIADLDINSKDIIVIPKLKMAIDILKSRVQADYTILMDKEIFDLPEECSCNISCLEDDIAFAVSVIGVMTGVGVQTLKSNYYVCHSRWSMSYGLWFYTLIHFPYALGMLGSKISVADLDKLYFGISKFFTSEKVFSKDCGEVRKDIIFLNTLEDADPKNSIVSLDVLRRMPGAYPALGKKALTENHFPANLNIVAALCELCGKDIRMSENVVKFLLNSQWYSPERVEELESKGIINSIDDSSVLLEKNLEKELLIFSTLIAKGNEPTGITAEMVESSIAVFEDSAGFKLEELQKEGIKLCMHKAGVLSGCAGSGKTTTSDCMSDCLTSHMPSGYKMVYCTPTGKACRRLAEVVHGEVRTIHSQFKVGLFGESVLERIYTKCKQPSCCIYLLDEMAMCNTSLLYEVVRNLGSNDLIYFLGDIKQLVSIGKGNPFNLLMKLLPCVELGVSKRAAEGSEVNYNTTLVNHVSDKETRELFYDDNSFMCRECPDNSIYLEASKAWKGFMNGSMNGKVYEEEDIQIITGYAKPTISFSTYNVNPAIQHMLRSKDKLLFKHGEREFYKNDRVIHINSNNYGVQRYIEIEPGYYKPLITLGVVNGEVGVLEGIVCSTTCSVEEVESFLEDPIYEGIPKETLTNLLEIREQRVDQIRDDFLVRNEKAYLVKVRLYDVDLQRNVYVFYRATAHVQDECISMVGSDLANLDLAYALTTHKMQGSQNKVVILLFGSTCNPSFINRNMINTMITRSQEVVCMVGSIKGEDSPVTKGRQTKSVMETKDILSLLVNEEL